MLYFQLVIAKNYFLVEIRLDWKVYLFIQMGEVMALETVVCDRNLATPQDRIALPKVKYKLGSPVLPSSRSPALPSVHGSRTPRSRSRVGTLPAPSLAMSSSPLCLAVLFLMAQSALLVACVPVAVFFIRHCPPFHRATKPPPARMRYGSE